MSWIPALSLNLTSVYSLWLSVHTELCSTLIGVCIAKQKAALLTQMLKASSHCKTSLESWLAVLVYLHWDSANILTHWICLLRPKPYMPILWSFDYKINRQSSELFHVGFSSIPLQKASCNLSMARTFAMNDKGGTSTLSMNCTVRWVWCQRVVHALRGKKQKKTHLWTLSTWTRQSDNYQLNSLLHSNP